MDNCYHRGAKPKTHQHTYIYCCSIIGYGCLAQEVDGGKAEDEKPHEAENVAANSRESAAERRQ